MANQNLTLNLPDALYERLKRLAENDHRSVEEEAVERLAASIPEDEALPADLVELLDSMRGLDDETLWRAARNDLARQASAGISRLQARRKRKGLTVAEQQRLNHLLRQYDRGLLIRAEAAALLKERGHDVNVLLVPVRQ
jgi:plasmid stability protein